MSRNLKNILMEHEFFLAESWNIYRPEKSDKILVFLMHTNTHTHNAFGEYFWQYLSGLPRLWRLWHKQETCDMFQPIKPHGQDLYLPEIINHSLEYHFFYCLLLSISTICSAPCIYLAFSDWLYWSAIIQRGFETPLTLTA